MTQLIVPALIVLLLFGVVFIFRTKFGDGGEEATKPKYRYTRKQFFMNRAEHEFYDALVQAVGHTYYVFAQVHLSTIVDHHVKGQNWNAAFRHINEKSVDFVLCDKAYISPKLAIEVDGRSHEGEKQKERDIEKEGILKDAGLPLLRIENHGSPNISDLKARIEGALR